MGYGCNVHKLLDACNRNPRCTNVQIRPDHRHCFLNYAPSVKQTYKCSYKSYWNKNSAAKERATKERGDKERSAKRAAARRESMHKERAGKERAAKERAHKVM